MREVTDKEYLSRKRITDVKINITPSYILITSPSTLWVNASRIEGLKKEELLCKYTTVYRLAKEKGVKIGRSRHIKKYIDEKWPEYKMEVEHYQNVFDKMIPLAKKVEERGIFYGCSDDIVLRRLMCVRNEYERVYWRTSVVSQMHDILHTLEQYEQELLGSTLYGYTLTKIVL